VLDNGDVRGALLGDHVHQEALAIACDRVLLLRQPGSGEARREQWDWRANVERCRISRLADGYYHQLAVGRDVKKLLPVPAPAWLAPACDRDSACTPRSREGPHVDLQPPRFVRAISDPPPVGGKLAF